MGSSWSLAKVSELDEVVAPATRRSSLSSRHSSLVDVFLDHDFIDHRFCPSGRLTCELDLIPTRDGRDKEDREQNRDPVSLRSYGGLVSQCLKMMAQIDKGLSRSVKPMRID